MGRLGASRRALALAARLTRSPTTASTLLGRRGAMPMPSEGAAVTGIRHLCRSVAGWRLQPWRRPGGAQGVTAAAAAAAAATAAAGSAPPHHTGRGYSSAAHAAAATAAAASSPAAATLASTAVPAHAAQHARHRHAPRGGGPASGGSAIAAARLLQQLLSGAWGSSSSRAGRGGSSGGGSASLTDVQRLARSIARRSRHEQRQIVLDFIALLEEGQTGGSGSSKGSDSAAAEAAAKVEMKGTLLVHALWVASRAAGCPVELRQRLFEEAVPAAYSSLSSLPSTDLARLLAAYASAPYYSQELFAGATEFVWDALPSLTPQQLSDVAVAYAAVGHYEDDLDLWEGIADRATERVEEFEPHQLAALLESTARLRFRHAPLCSAALGAAADDAMRWSTTSLAQLVWALGWLGHGVGPGEGPLLDRVGATVATRLRNLMTSTDVTRMVSAGVVRVPGSGVPPGSSMVAGGGGGSSGPAAVMAGSSGDVRPLDSGGPAGFLGLSKETAALTAGPYSWHPSSDSSSSGSGQDVQQRPQRRGGGSSASGDSLTFGRTTIVTHGGGTAGGGGAADANAEANATGGTTIGYVSDTDDDVDCVRPSLEPPSALRDGLCRLAWGYLSLNRLPNALLRETFKLLASFPPASFSQPQLALLFEAGCRAQEIGHGLLDIHPLMATSARVFVAETKRAPRTLSLSPDLQPHAFAAWLRGTRHGRAPLAPPPLLAAQHLRARCQPRAVVERWNNTYNSTTPSSSSPSSSSGPQPEPQWPEPAAERFTSWRFRDAAATTRAGLESSVAAALCETAAITEAPPAPALTLDGVLTVAVPVARSNTRIAVEVLPPESAAVNPPHAPLGPAGVRAAMLRYRGWGVAPVAFAEWAAAQEEGAGAVAAFLQNGVDGAESDTLCTVR